jgi:hypothetical protein
MAWGNEAAGGAGPDSQTFEAFSLDTDGVDADALGSGGTLDLPGNYHFEIEDVIRDLETVNKNGQPKSPGLKFVLAVKHAVPGQCAEGSRFYHRIYLAGKGGAPIAQYTKERAIIFGLSLGILKQVEGGKIVDAITGKAKLGVEMWEAIRGHQCCGTIIKKAKKPFVRKPLPGQPAPVVDPNAPTEYEFLLKDDRVYNVDDPFVAAWPKNERLLASIGKSSADSADVGDEDDV